MAKVNYTPEQIARCEKIIGMDSAALMNGKSSIVEVFQDARSNAKRKKNFRVLPFHKRVQRGKEKALKAKKDKD